MTKRAQPRKKSKKPQRRLDAFLERKPRGRPGVNVSEIRGRAEHFRQMFEQVWDGLSGLSPKPKTAEDVIQVFDKAGTPFAQEFVPALAHLILEVLHDPHFPKTREAQIKFLADSLAGRGRISPSRSRDICERKREKTPHYIVRRDFYIECTCGYEGPAYQGACPHCGTERNPPSAIDFNP